ncbi:hypothetical protein CWATWH0402_1103 [Crocosphaera watsonii WH 0402]|uniref:Uncharacterized protein n=1 Tax=Crocosphaera watsonii WH 0402 TaxID=1284629 RepID=T2JTP8_CROWT|nr:hypothetical protein CWATWH0402_1103 [Crocosphaera watsonii WH 0402]
MRTISVESFLSQKTWQPPSGQHKSVVLEANQASYNTVFIIYGSSNRYTTEIVGDSSDTYLHWS